LGIVYDLTRLSLARLALACDAAWRPGRLCRRGRL